jgi:hypothetical protein
LLPLGRAGTQSAARPGPSFRRRGRTGLLPWISEFASTCFVIFPRAFSTVSTGSGQSVHSPRDIPAESVR